jgi:hypothetical protein
VIAKAPAFSSFLTIFLLAGALIPFLMFFYELFRGHCASCQSSIFSEFVFCMNIKMENLRIKNFFLKVKGKKLMEVL